MTVPASSGRVTRPHRNPPSAPTVIATATDAEAPISRVTRPAGFPPGPEQLGHLDVHERRERRVPRRVRHERVGRHPDDAVGERREERPQPGEAADLDEVLGGCGEPVDDAGLEAVDQRQPGRPRHRREVGQREQRAPAQAGGDGGPGERDEQGDDDGGDPARLEVRQPGREQRRPPDEDLDALVDPLPAAQRRGGDQGGAEHDGDEVPAQPGRATAVVVTTGRDGTAVVVVGANVPEHGRHGHAEYEPDVVAW